MEALFSAWPMFHLRMPLGRPVRLADRSEPDWEAVLAELAADAQLTEAITLASADLSRTAATVLDGTGPAAANVVRRAAQSMLRYAIRASSRPTPFGLFAGTCFGRFDSASKIDFGGTVRTHTRPDLAWLLALVERLQSDPAVLPKLSVVANEAIYRRDGRIVLDTPSTYGIAAGEQGRTGVSVRATRPVLAVLEQAGQARPVGTLVESLASQFSVDRERIFSLIRSMVQQDLLITDLRPPMDGRDPLSHVQDRLRSVTGPELDAVTGSLDEIDRLRRAYDRIPIGSGTAELRQLQQAVALLGPTRTPLHVDTSVSATVVLGRQVQEEAERALTVLWLLSESRLGMRSPRAWHSRFLERYGVGRLVDLAEAVDDTVGLGAPAGYAWPTSEAGEPTEAPPSAAHIRRDMVLGRLMHRCLATGSEEVVLDDDDVRSLQLAEPRLDRLPPSCELFLHLVAPSASAIDAGEFRLVVSQNPGSHRAGASLSRFAYTDESSEAEFAQLMQATPSAVPGAQTVDLTYATRGPRAANILNIPVYSGRRIAVSLPDSPAATRVRLADLAVGATLDELYLMDKRTGRLVEPVSNNMTSPATQAPNVARLLFELGMEGRRLWEPWSWGQLSVHPVLPRVRYGRTVLCPKTWKVDSLRDALASAKTVPARRQAVQDWQSRWSVPGQILAVSADQRLLFDLADSAHAELFAQEIQRDDRLMVQEPPDACAADGWFDDGQGGRPVELVIPFVRRPEIPVTPPVVAAARFAACAPPRAERLIPPGGDWLYVSLYGSRRGQDELLRKHIGPLLPTLRELGADRWFYIRYSDAEGQHLRLRLQGSPSDLRNAVLDAVVTAIQAWRADRLVGAVRWSDYDPEYERYGGLSVSAAAHAFFEADSAFALSALDVLDNGALDRHTVAAVSATSLVDEFGTPGELRDPTAPEQPKPGQPTAGWWLSITGERRDLPAEYRKQPMEWRRLLAPDWAELRTRPGGPELVAALDARRPATAAYAAALRQLGPDCPTPARRLVGSLLHMTCNRLLGGYPELEALALGLARGAAQDNERAVLR